MSKNHKGMICLLSEWEWEDLQAGIKPDCRKHRHLSRRRACERLGAAQFADRDLADVHDAQHRRIGFIVEVGGRVIWTDRLRNLKSKVRIDPACWKIINSHMNRLQAIIDSGEPRRYEIITLPTQAVDPPVPPRSAAISETLKSYSECSLTAKDAEANAEGAWAKERAQRDQER